MSKFEQTNEKTFITLPLDGGPRDFDELEELSEWAKRQRNSLSWLQKAIKGQGNIQQAWNVLNDSIQRVEHFCSRFAQMNEQQRLSEAQDQTKHFTNVVNKGAIRTTESSDSAFVDALRKEHSDIVAAYAYAFLTNHDSQIQPDHAT